jgi:dipeptidyl-peptidase-4
MAVSGQWIDRARVIGDHSDRKNESKLMLCNTATGDVKTIYNETDEAWV